MNDLISREDAINALWKALCEYEDKTEKQFQESDELDVGAWIVHRIFVQNMSDIDRQTILNLPSAQPEQRWIPVTERLPEKSGLYLVTTPFDRLMPVHSRYFNKRGEQSEQSFWSGHPMNEVVAWMPLPQPYKGEQE